jgi:hypothetical protein
MRIRLAAIYALGLLANVGLITFSPAQTAATSDSLDRCLFRTELYSFGAIICIGKNRALRCDGPDQRFRTAHWTLLKPESTDIPYSDATLEEACAASLPNMQE